MPFSSPRRCILNVPCSPSNGWCFKASTQTKNFVNRMKIGRFIFVICSKKKQGDVTDARHFMWTSGTRNDHASRYFCSSHPRDHRWAIDGDQDMEAQHSRRGKTFRISTLQVPFVVSFTGQNVPFALQPVAMAPRYLTNENIFSSTERPWSQLSIELKISHFPPGRNRFHSLEPTKTKCQFTVRPYWNCWHHLECGASLWSDGFLFLII